MSIHKRIETKITEALSPLFIDIVNESHQHSVPENSETHFKILVVSAQFEDLSRIDRHRKVQAVIEEEFKDGLHAINLKLFSPAQWEKVKSDYQHSSPSCQGSQS